MEFRTAIEALSLGLKIDYGSKGFGVGSCFVQNITERMERSKLAICTNPFGILFNPFSIAHMFDILTSGHQLTKEDLTFGNGVWFSYLFHGSFSDNDCDKALLDMNRAIKCGSQALLDADYVIITFGTSWVYELVSNRVVVSNCHKQTTSDFNHKRVSVGEIVEKFSSLLNSVLRDKRVIFTVSPIRHLGDGLVDNSVSKATLRVAIEELCQRFDNALYFPSFEMMVDDLRDYRFYGDDMLHPTKTAIDYIWQKFCGATMNSKMIANIGRFEQLTTAVQHHLFNPESAESKKFKSSMLKVANQLSEEFPSVDLSAEVEYFSP